MPLDMVVTASGPLFDGEAIVESDLALKASVSAIAMRGQELVRSQFNSSINKNSGQFLASIQTTSEARDYSVSTRNHTYSMMTEVPPGSVAVTTSRADYGPWLEGTGSRNQTTRFKGYWGFRNATGRLDSEVSDVADVATSPFVARMNL